jgi:hypothetical protein
MGRKRRSAGRASGRGGGGRPTIARIWRGRTPAARAEEYARYLYDHGIKPLEEKALGVHLFREDRGEETEFVTISYWESVAAMSRSPAAIRGVSTTCRVMPGS